MVLTTMLELFVSFLKIGMTSFGGMSMVPLINVEMLNHGWMTVREVADIVAIAEMTPGPLGLNCATFAGMRVAGLPGAVCANLGVLFPTYSIGWVAAVFFERFKSSNIMQCLLYGIRPVCIGMVISVVIDLSQSNYMLDGNLYIQPILIGIVALILLMKGKQRIPVVIIVSAVLGILIVR
ncbi:MAG: chromate transporter [Clostridiales bacterium]|nr:chromate transporter [Clostridiales bacterium]